MRHLKHITFKCIASVLATLMVIYLLPNTVVAEAIASIGNATDRFGEPHGQSDNICELESLREESVKHFRLEDGSCIAVQYSNPVHTLDDNGKWQDIDNTSRANKQQC